MGRRVILALGGTAGLLAAQTWQEVQRSGEEAFRQGKIEESIRLFDRAIRMEPRLGPHNWQRGIALYYAGRFADCKEQFAGHRSVNPEDVENAAWHFLCTARADGIAAAKRSLIPVSGDTRVPMKEVQRMFGGALAPDAVLGAAGSGEAVFYAHLYIGLWYEAQGKAGPAREHVEKAAARAPAHYMGDVARVHLARLPKQRRR
jgi:lipoprotein NlpI